MEFLKARGSTILLIGALLALAPACSDMESDSGASEEAAAPAGGGAPAAANAAPAGDMGNTMNAVGLVVELPGGWQQQPPESQMRAGQAVVPGSDGEGQLIVFHFGPGGGGGVDANLQRWVGQVTNAEEPTRGAFDAGDLEVTWVDVRGTLARSTIGGFPPMDMPGWGLVGAVIEGPGGPWFFKLVGPNATLEEQREPFFDMLRDASVSG
jgi:hypothetical protein